MDDYVKFLALTQGEAEIVLDSFKCTNVLTRGIALKAAGLVLEFAADDAVRVASQDLGSKVLDLPPAPGHDDDNNEKKERTSDAPDAGPTPAS